MKIAPPLRMQYLSLLYPPSLLISCMLQRVKRNCRHQNLGTSILLLRPITIWQPEMQDLRFHTGGYEEFYRLRYNGVRSVGSQPTFRGNVSPPPSASRVCSQARNQHKPESNPVAGFLAYSSTWRWALKMAAAYSFEMSVHFKGTTRRYTMA
jgi:hypothetical protein